MGSVLTSPAWLDEGPPIEFYDSEFWEVTGANPPDEPEKEAVEEKPVVAVEPVKLDEVGQWIAALSPEEDGSYLESVDWRESRIKACKVARERKTFVLNRASHDEIAMRAVLDIADGPAVDGTRPTRAFWTFPRERPMMSTADLKVEVAEALVVFADGAIWRYNQNAGCWLEIWHETVNWSVYAYSGFQHGEPRKNGEYQTLFLTSGMVASIRSIMFDIRGKDGFFKGVRRNGLPMASGYWVPKQGRMEREPHTPWNLLRSAYQFDWFENSKKVLEAGTDVKAWDPLGEEFWEHCPIWMWFLRRLFDDKKDAAQTFQEWLAATLTGQATQHQVALIFVGIGGAGKGTLLKAMALLFPPGSVCSTNPGAWKDPWDRLPLIGKLLNICLETDAFSRLDPIKGVMSGDPIEARRTGAQSGPPFNYNPIAGHAFSCNSMPRVPHMDSATTDRFIVLPFERKFRGASDQIKEGHLLHALKSELPGILFWVAAGMLRLAETGKILRPACSAALLRQWTLSSDPVARFLEEKVNLDKKDAWEPGEKFYFRFREWCLNDGIQKPMERPKFTEELKVKGIPVEVRGPKAARVRAYVGVQLNS